MAEADSRMLEETRLQGAAARIHEQVMHRYSRAELTRDGCDDVCVLISKAELEGLEQALELLSASAEYRAMCDHLNQLAAQCASWPRVECEA